ncbi:uncharacterized protein Bfra_001326 [Botrytis fragariae]|uniref:Uncharacterized protein n=1 Tax=Botrytis fragariae TaxID=1964551 RepID=A0A8H6B042_9HELO|nr:uncharacterized protein Bfra_001326 [Botrytis fragariae]KAF5876968.1 hypothetical protein Bfra_001326 [Botrytis fragariae]
MTSTAPCLSPQVIDGHYVDPRKLISLLQRVYGTVDGNNNFRVELRLNRYKIYRPSDDDNVQTLTEIVEYIEGAIVDLAGVEEEELVISQSVFLLIMRIHNSASLLVMEYGCSTH